MAAEALPVHKDAVQEFLRIRPDDKDWIDQQVAVGEIEIVEQKGSVENGNSGKN